MEKKHLYTEWEWENSDVKTVFTIAKDGTLTTYNSNGQVAIVIEPNQNNSVK